MERDLGKAFKVPGIGQPVFEKQPIYWEKSTPSYFTWGEATKGGNRIPVSDKQTYAIVAIAKRMDMLRKALAQPIIITSWYRDPITNKNVGGARYSQHLKGNAVDFRPAKDGITLEIWKEICRLWPDGGLAAGNGFFHVDSRSGYAHWVYRGGPSWASRRY